MFHFQKSWMVDFVFKTNKRSKVLGQSSVVEHLPDRPKDLDLTPVMQTNGISFILSNTMKNVEIKLLFKKTLRN